MTTIPYCRRFDWLKFDLAFSSPSWQLRCCYYVFGTLVSELFVGPISSTQTNPTHQTTDPTQPNPSQIKNFGPTNQPNYNPTELHTTNNKPSGIRKVILGTLFHRNIV